MSERHPLVEIDSAILSPLREICLDYPEAVEAVAFGSPTFQVRSKNFAMVHKPDHHVAVWCKAPSGAQAAYIQSEPDRYFAPPYLGPKGWIAAWISPDCDPDWIAIADIVDESYRLIAPKSLVAAIG
ncbi:MAG: MmcQ/YjbR family DNA-binding protein [Thermomicrobiales bacterium]